MNLISRPALSIPLKNYCSPDTVEELKQEYIKRRNYLSGKTVSDVALIYTRAMDWVDVDVLDSIIPYEFRTQSNEPLGHRMWYLSQECGTRYYNGWWFDYQVSLTGIRKIRRRYRICKNATMLFSIYPEIKNNCTIQ